MLQINSKLWHPCNLDIIEHKVISIRQYEGFNHYVLKAVRDVGACGKVEVLISENAGKFRFIELLTEHEHSSGLRDFVEGNYFTDKESAELEFYEQQRVLTWSNMDQKKRWYEEAKIRHEQVNLIVTKIKEKIKGDSK